MLFSAKTLLLGGATLLAGLSGLVTADDCANGPWENVLSVGGSGGDSFCATKYTVGTIITGVEVWANGDGVRGVQFYYSDGTNSGQKGTADGDKHHRLDWDPAHVQISQIKAWGNGKGTALGRVYIRTTSGAELDVGKTTGGQKAYEPAVASGVMLGAVGGTGGAVNYLGFLFLKSKISKMDVGDIVFDQTPDFLNAQQQGLEAVVLDYADHTNGLNDSTETFTFSKTLSQTNTKKFSLTATDTFGISEAIEVSGEILDLGAKSTTTLSYQYALAETEESSKEDTISLTYLTATTLKPGQQVFCRATAMSGKFSGDYSGTVNIHLADGTTYSFTQRGTMNQIKWSKASSECQGTDFAPTQQQKRDARRAIEFVA